jgi:hypothetical protein
MQVTCNCLRCSTAILYGRAMAQAVSRCLPTQNARFRFQSCVGGTFGAKEAVGLVSP